MMNVSYKLLGHVRKESQDARHITEAKKRGISPREVFLEEHNDHLCEQNRYYEREWLELYTQVQELKAQLTVEKII